jgi:glutaredoxin
MSDPRLQPALSQLLRDTAQAHHEAFAATDGADPDWPIWYADHLREPMEQVLRVEFHRSQLIYCLMNADFEHIARAPETDWADFYADEFIEHYAASETAGEDTLALYYMASCPFCRRVMRVIARLGLDVEMRDVFADSTLRDELIQARGRPTVPVLWIKSPDGEVRWMPESSDIIHYLESMYG